MPERRARNRVARRLAVFGPAGIVVLTGLLAYGAIQRLTATRTAVQHTHDVLDASTTVLGALLDAETATRGYVITHDSTFLDPARTAPVRAQAAISSLRRLTADNPRQQVRIDSLTARANVRLHMLDSIADLERKGGFDISSPAVKTSPGPVVMAQARQLIAEIQREEDSLLVSRRDDESRAIETAGVVVAIGALLAAILAFVVNRKFDSALVDRRKALDDVVSVNERLQQNAIQLEQQAEAARGAAILAELASEQARTAQRVAEESEERAERLQAATEALTGALGIGEVASLIVEQAVRALGAHSGALALHDSKTGRLRFLALDGVSGVNLGDEVSIDGRLPMAVAARTAKPVLLGSREQIREQFPEIAGTHGPDGVQAVAAFPLITDGAVAGVLLVRFDRPHGLSVADQAFMSAMSRIAAEAFERARLFEAEREARRAAEAANRAKASFLASMSHELRTPLQAALGFAQLVRSGVYGAVNEQQSEVLGRVERSQTHLARLIDDILDFARLEAGRVRIDPSPVRLVEVIGDLGPLVEAQASKKQIELSLLPPDESLVVIADRHRLQQILVNIVGNAIKFTPENGTIRLGAVRDGSQARIFVRDTGRGIPADRLQAIFEPFVQVESSLTRTVSGAGLGLAISRDLARAMGGDLTVESELGVGSTFTVVLPLASPSPT